MSKIAVVATSTIEAIKIGRYIYIAAVNAMDAAEVEMSSSGASKKAWVLAFVKSLVQENNDSWDTWFKLISDFIDNIKTAYNSLKYLF